MEKKNVDGIHAPRHMKVVGDVEHTVLTILSAIGLVIVLAMFAHYGAFPLQ